MLNTDIFIFFLLARDDNKLVQELLRSYH
ncbi:uncharacterized protein METZ01_LOCUS1786 [marine metagenome]|uniref:Uncharacterized protein n=1 Tax=marine metagenome TaxID=408172 RepID=A0A381N2U0_9ZZZZ